MYSRYRVKYVTIKSRQEVFDILRFDFWSFIY